MLLLAGAVSMIFSVSVPYSIFNLYIYIIYMRTYINIYKYSTIQYRVELPLFLSQRQPPVAFPYRCKKVEHKIVPVF